MGASTSDGELVGCCGVVVFWWCGDVVFWCCSVLVVWCFGDVVFWWCGVLVMWFLVHAFIHSSSNQHLKVREYGHDFHWSDMRLAVVFCNLW